MTIDERKKLIQELVDFYSRLAKLKYHVKVEKYKSEEIGAKVSNLNNNPTIFVSTALLNMKIDASVEKYLHRLLAHEIIHLKCEDYVTDMFFATLGKWPDIKICRVYRLLHLLKEERADILGMQLVNKGGKVILQSEQDIEDSFMDCTKESDKLSKSWGYAIGLKRKKFAYLYGRRTDLVFTQVMVQDILKTGHSYNNVDSNYIKAVIAKKYKRAKKLETQRWYGMWLNLI